MSTFEGANCPDCNVAMVRPTSYMFTLHAYILPDGRWRLEKLYGSHNDEISSVAEGQTVKEALARLEWDGYGEA